MLEIPNYILTDFMRTCSKHGLKLSDTLGEGGFGRVYAGTRDEPYPEDEERTNNYAVKLTLDTEDTHEHLEREIRIQKELAHPNIVRIYQVIVNEH